jgi:hypothetical protein
MPHRQTHRGRHPEDDRLFSEAQLPTLRAAVGDLSFLLTRGYAEKASLKVVGDHYQLAARQRRAVLGAACPDEAIARRAATRVSDAALVGRTLIIDGYNLLIGVEALLGNAVQLRGRDGCIRDIASIHGSYRIVEETVPALDVIGRTLAGLDVGEVRWRFDAPVSNSGRLKVLLEERAGDHGWPWEVRLLRRVNQHLADSNHIVVTSDSWILDRAGAWYPVIDAVAAATGSGGRVLDLSGD